MDKTYTFLLIGAFIAVLYGIQKYAVPLMATPAHDKKDGFCGGCTKY